MMEATVHGYGWRCHSKGLATLQEVRCKQVKTARYLGFQKKSCQYLPPKIFLLATWGWICWPLNSCCFKKACKSTWASLLWWTETLSSKQPDSKKNCFLWNEGQVHSWKVQCRTSHWLFCSISQLIVIGLHINKQLSSILQGRKLIKKWEIIVHWMCYVTFLS